MKKQNKETKKQDSLASLKLLQAERETHQGIVSDTVGEEAL
jgi:hypothetical protein